MAKKETAGQTGGPNKNGMDPLDDGGGGGTYVCGGDGSSGEESTVEASLPTDAEGIDGPVGPAGPTDGMGEGADSPVGDEPIDSVGDEEDDTGEGESEELQSLDPSQMSAGERVSPSMGSDQHLPEGPTCRMDSAVPEAGPFRGLIDALASSSVSFIMKDSFAMDNTFVHGASSFEEAGQKLSSGKFTSTIDSETGEIWIHPIE